VAIPPELKPTQKRRVIDLAEEAGLDVSDWANYANGARNPGANPKYCYEWALGEPKRLIVCNLWLRNMSESPDGIEQHLMLSDTPENAEEDTTRRARRARMRSLILEAHREGAAIRVIVVDGKRRQESKDGKARIEARTLDPLPWFVKRIENSTGVIVLRRGSGATTYVDQFALREPLPGSGEVRTVIATVRQRSSEVRLYALRRARGVCEYCGVLGFRLPDGSIYLETHHIEPLAKGGPDSTDNVVALCPNHHREAHFGAAAAEINVTLRKRLAK
jgi:5-methylcytosine-specific restriction protein A